MGFFSDFKQGLYQGLTGNRGGSVDEAAVKSQRDANAFTEALNYRGSASQMAQELSGGGYTADPNWAPIDPNNQNYYSDLYQKLALLGHSSPEFAAKQQEIAYKQPELSPWITTEMKNAKASGYDINDPNAFSKYQDIDANRKATRITNNISPTMQMADPNWDNIPLSKDLWDKVEWVDPANNGKIMTNGDARLGRIKMKGSVTEDARGKANVYGVLLETGGRELDPLYQQGGRLSKEVRRRARDNSVLTDPVARQAWTDQILIDQPFQLLKDKYLSPEGKQLEQGSNLITEPVLRISTGAAAPDAEQTRFKMMLAPKVSDTDQVLLTKRVAQKMLGTVIKGQAMGFHVDPINTDDVYLGEVKTGKGNQMIFAYDIKHNRIYAAMTDGSKHVLTDEEQQQFLSGD